MKLTLAGTEYQSDLFPLLKLTIGEARVIKRNTGMNIGQWRNGLSNLGEEDADVLAALVFLLRSRAGETVDDNWDELDALSEYDIITGFDFTVTENDKRDAETQTAEDAARAVMEAEKLLVDNSTPPTAA
jgi:phospholipase C